MRSSDPSCDLQFLSNCFWLKLFWCSSIPTLCFPSFLHAFHRMVSAEEEQFGTESPDDALLVDVPEQPKKKGKGGKTKTVNNARGIPASVHRRLGYDTPPEETKQQHKKRLQGIRR